MTFVLSLCHAGRTKDPKTPQFLVYSSCGHIACAHGLPATLLSRGPLQHNIHSEPLIQNIHTLSLPGCQGPQVVVPSLWVPYLPTISLVYWSFLYWIHVTCSPKANAISVWHCFLEHSPRATCLLWLVFILLDHALVLPYRKKCSPFWPQWTGAWLRYSLYFDRNRYSALTDFEFLDYYKFSRSHILTCYFLWG